ncbi:MAG: 30S ribosomal protein S8 [Candidatus Micrarchaeia archaeon]|jgi:small subunit ribosomal protein S8
MTDNLANALNAVKVSEGKGKHETVVPASKLIREVFTILQREGYIGNFEFREDGKSGTIKVSLVGKVNNCGVVSPRFSVKQDEWEKWEQRYLPARNVGVLVISTSKGLLTNVEARAQGVGGRLVAFVY